MPRSGRIHPEPDDDGSGERGGAAIPGPELPDLIDLTGHDAALEVDLRELAPGSRRDTPAERAARLEADRRIVSWLAVEGFEGPSTNKLLIAEFEYATPMMRFLIGTGRIFDACNRLRRPVRRQPGDVAWTAEDREFLTETSVDAGIFHLFHEYGLRQGRWDPAYKTSLATYGVNACVLCFPPVYQKWWRGRVLERSFGDLAADLPGRLQADVRQADPADLVTDRMEAERLLRQIPEPARTALWLRGMEGATQAEAADFVGLTEKALEGRIGRARANLGLSAGNLPKASRPRTLKPEPELEAQEGDRDR
jgi:hypothetical protein